MQNKYVGDIGDFGKYGLLRHLTGMTDKATPRDALHLGVVWYLYPDEKGKTDGKFTKYLKNPTAKDQELRDCDPKLYWVLRRLVRECNRNVFSVRMNRILPQETAYYSQSLSFHGMEPLSSNQERRQSWLKGALAAISEADVVFVDPDNGITETIEPLREKGPQYLVRPWHSTGPKYVFMDDICEFYEQCKNLVIYHHIARWDTADNQIRYFSERLKKCLKLEHLPWALRYHRGTTRAYFIIAQGHRKSILEKRIKSFLDSPWCAAPFRHFKQVT